MVSNLRHYVTGVSKYSHFLMTRNKQLFVSYTCLHIEHGVICHVIIGKFRLSSRQFLQQLRCHVKPLTATCIARKKKTP